jgi:hypothetical protein
MANRPSKCTVCSHREHAGIDLALARGVSVTAIARRYKLGTDSLYRHSKAHLPPQLRAALIAGPELDIDLDKLKETESQSLLAHLIAIRQRLFAALDTAEEFGDAHMITRTTSQLHANLALTGQLLGDLGIGNSTTINNVLVLPAYVEMRVALVQALAPFPEARQAAAAALHELESKAAETIKPKELANDHD